MESKTPTFNFLLNTESTNNCAMDSVRAGLAVHGEAWYAHEQTQGRGQRGRKWESYPGENITMSMAIQRLEPFKQQPFLLSMAVALAVLDYLQNRVRETVQIKWPNDLYINDRKAGGILIANQYRGLEWCWAVAGMGININQRVFSDTSGRPISLAQLTGEKYEVVEEARRLQRHVIDFLEHSVPDDLPIDYNRVLYKRGEVVRLKKEDHIIDCRIKEVTVEGLLIAENEELHQFRSGELEWVF